MWLNSACFLVGAALLMDGASGVVWPHQRNRLVDLLVWGTHVGVELDDYPADVRAKAEVVIARSKGYQSRRPPPEQPSGLLEMVHEARVAYERRLIAMARTPGADTLAVAYVSDLAPCYEWEGCSDCPAREASFAHQYLQAHPDGPFRDFLPLLEAHRWLCAAEGFDYEKNAGGAGTARSRYLASLQAASKSRDPLVRIAASELEARGTCFSEARH
jgi:hypothetical protein